MIIYILTGVIIFVGVRLYTKDTGVGINFGLLGGVFMFMSIFSLDLTSENGQRWLKYNTPIEPSLMWEVAFTFFPAVLLIVYIYLCYKKIWLPFKIEKN